ncbi:MAG: SGNH/GDSL hydrolase family protein [Spirochaetaceae bacterium]|jgi:lysophospholipase L1-like esterase|nr:SGNH/GDSL hydrolase family protein [Spirochaetaceae bacterium]
MSKTTLIKTLLLAFMALNPVSADSIHSAGIDDSVYQNAIAASLLQTGNTTRIQRLIKKAQAGEDVSLAFLGGSITEGSSASPQKSNCYVALFTDWFTTTYAKDASKVHQVNAGLSGTPSLLGLMRYQCDVLEKAAFPPDLVIVEFAVNDSNQPDACAQYESLVRNIFNGEGKPAVLLLFSFTGTGYTTEPQIKKVGEAYALPMVSMKTALKAGAISDADYFNPSDRIHPTNKGHKVIADCLANAFTRIAASPSSSGDAAFPKSPVYGNDYEGIIPIDSRTTSTADMTINKGGFSGTDLAVYTSGYTGKPDLIHNFMHKANANNAEALSISLECKNFVLAYKIEGNWTSTSKNGLAGKAEVYVDGKLTKTLDSFQNSNGAWQESVPQVIFNKPVSAQHDIQIKMAPGDEGKAFTVTIMGYTK